MRHFAIAMLLGGSIGGLVWSLVSTTSMPGVSQRPRIVNSIRDEGEACVSGPRLTPQLLEQWPEDYDNQCVEIRLEVRCVDECTARLPGGAVLLVDVAAAMHDLRLELQAGDEPAVGLLGRFRTAPRPSLDVTRVLSPWW